MCLAYMAQLIAFPLAILSPVIADRTTTLETAAAAASASTAAAAAVACAITIAIATTGAQATSGSVAKILAF